MEFTKHSDCKIAKIDTRLGLVFGWAVVCSQDSQPYFDLQGHNIEPSGLLKAASEFMLKSRRARKQHTEESAGEIVFCWPLTADIAGAFGIESRTTGLMIGMKCTKEVLAKFADGTYSGFSIGGFARKMQDVEG